MDAGADQSVLVRMPPGATPPAYLERWHPEPFGDPGLAARIGLDRWFISRTGEVPSDAERAERPEPGGVAGWPSDPLFPDQWSLHQATDVDVDALAAFLLAGELIAGSPSPHVPIIAVIDSEMTGLGNPYWPDLPIAIAHTTPLNLPGNFVPPYCTHAVHVASIAAAAGNNAVGLAGVAWNAEIWSLQVLLGCGGTQADCATGVVFAADNGADVINMSLQYGDTPAGVLEDACLYAWERGLTLVAASGNYAWTDKLAVPAMLPTVIGVGAIDRTGNRAEFSNAGPDLELCAPGVQVLGYTNTGTAEWTGTSMASPHVAGAAILLKSIYPSLTNETIREVLVESADDMGDPGRDSLFGHGRLNVYRALIMANRCYADFNHDGELTPADFAAFQSAFSAGRHRANCNGDLHADDSPALTAADFACFQSKFAAGPCPR